MTATQSPTHAAHAAPTEPRSERVLDSLALDEITSLAIELAQENLTLEEAKMLMDSALCDCAAADDA